MDRSVFVLSHNGFGPTNIIINGDRIMVLDWELAGYVHMEWVRTKFAIWGALWVERVSSTGIERDSEYPVRVERKLGEMGFTEVTEAYKAIERNRRETGTRQSSRHSPR
jgi:hypothetical protein